jgi:hypothetical protein
MLHRDRRLTLWLALMLPLAISCSRSPAEGTVVAGMVAPRFSGDRRSQ